MLLGLIGALMMFAGDMTLYYTPDDYEHDGTLRPIMNIMKRLDRTRLYPGGMPGPIAAFVNCLGIIGGGAYHSHCANLGLITRHSHDDDIKEVTDFLDVSQALGFVALAVFIVMGWTVLPRWLLLLTPAPLMLLPLLRKLPKGIHIIVCGGRTNLISVIYYAAALTAVCAKG